MFLYFLALIGLFVAVILITAVLSKLYVRHKIPELEPDEHGVWLETSHPNHKRCSVCHVICFIGMYPNGNANHCPNCGARMEVAHDNTDSR